MSDERTAISREDRSIPHLIDMHCHLDWCADAAHVADDAASRGIGFFCTPVTPSDSAAASALFERSHNVHVGVGLHPWWIASNPECEAAIDRAIELAAHTRFIGEIGLDLAPSHLDTKRLQLEAFERIVNACARNPIHGRVLSLHAIYGATEILDILERHDMAGNAACIFHWFSGTSDELTRLRKLGCYISVNERMLATKRGREYARQVPLGKLLIESDEPAQPNSAYTAEDFKASLNRTIETLAHIRDIDKAELTHAIAQTSSQLLFS